MDYYRIWNELRMRQGQLYVLEIKEKANEITPQDMERKKELESEIDHWNLIEVHWNKYGQDGFDSEGNMK